MTAFEFRRETKLSMFPFYNKGRDYSYTYNKDQVNKYGQIKKFKRNDEAESTTKPDEG